MKKSLSILAALSTVALSLPLALAESSSSTSSTMSSSSAMSVDSSSSAMSASSAASAQGTMSACAMKTGLERVACVHTESKARNPDTGGNARNSRLGDTANTCGDKKDLEKLICLRAHTMGSAMMKKEVKMMNRMTNGSTRLKQVCGDLKGHDRAVCLQSMMRSKTK